MRLNRSGETIERPINKVYPLEMITENKSMRNEIKCKIRRAQRDAAAMREVKRQYDHF